MNFPYVVFSAYRPVVLLCLFVTMPHHADARVDIPTQPLLVRASVAPLNMLVVGKDHMLYTGAYDDTVDLDPERNDGIDIGFRPSKIKYAGYFNPDLCYEYNATSKVFLPAAAFSSGSGCAGTRWSGSFLNYVSMSRMDLIRKALYGGKRVSSTGPGDILERSSLPLDAHVWGKELSKVLPDGTLLSWHINTGASLTNFPAGGGSQTIGAGLNNNRKLWVANMDVSSAPSVRMALASQNADLSEWIRTEGNSKLGGDFTPFSVRVRVCDDKDLDPLRCRNYQGRNRPIGLIQKYGSSDGVRFGLLTSSYDQPREGGVLRSRVHTLADEVMADGSFVSGGIAYNLDRLKINKPNSSYSSGGNGNWGNPMAEMLYESVRYFSGKLAATSSYVTVETVDSSLGLSRANWINPYGTTSSQSPWCAKPFVTLIGNAITSFDTDLPGSRFNSVNSDVSDLNVGDLATALASFEAGVFPGSLLVGEVAGSSLNVGLPTGKSASSFNIRGVSPNEPTRAGGYYAAMVAYHARTQGLLNSAFPSFVGEEEKSRPRLKTFSIAAMNPIPKISVGGVEVMPYGRVVNGATNTLSIVSFVLKEYAPGIYAKFTVNFDDAEDGSDYDLDSIVDYEINYDKNTNRVKVKVVSTYAQSGYWNHMGFVVSGVRPLTSASDENKAGAYLVVRENQLSGDTSKECITSSKGANPLNYGLSAGSCRVLPLIFEKEFEVDRTAVMAKRLEDPLWYAAKYGGFSGENTFSNEKGQWDADLDGTPDAYFLATNPLKMEAQFESAFRQMSQQAGSATAGAASSRELASGPLFLKVGFRSENWEGDLRASKVTLGGDGRLLFTEQWNARSVLQSDANRQIVFGKGSSGGLPFLSGQAGMPALTAAQVSYLRGNASNEGKNAGQFRPRPNTKLGDIHGSSPVYYNYGSQVERVFVGANDGMLHVFDAKTGAEAFAFVPNKVLSNLVVLSSQNYPHQFYVDGVLSVSAVDDDKVLLAGGLGAGGKGWFLLDVSDPAQLKESNATSIVKWELSDADDPDIGYSYGKPHIVRLNDGKFWVLLPNGYNSTSGKAGLLLVPLDRPSSGWSGAVVKMMTADTGGNGLSNLAPHDLDKDGKIDLVYAGDLKGNVWRFDLSGQDSAAWSASVPVRLFSANDKDGIAQPIVAAPALAKHPSYSGARVTAQNPNLMVMVGTGKFFESCDKLVTGCTGEASSNTVYGLWDNGVPVCGRNELMEQTLGVVVKGGTKYRTVTNNQPQWVDFEESKLLDQACSSRPSLAGRHLGWREDLNLARERVVDSIRYENKMLQYQTYLPASSDDVCKPADESYLMRVNFSNGGRFTKSRLNDPQVDAIREPQIVGKGTSGSLGSVDLRRGGKVFTVMSSTTGAEIEPIEWRVGRTVGRVTWRELLEVN